MGVKIVGIQKSNIVKWQTLAQTHKFICTYKQMASVEIELCFSEAYACL